MPVIGSTGLVFGIADETYGLVENATVTETCQTAKAVNGAGAVKGVSFFGNEKTLDFNFIFLVVTNIPSAQVGTGTIVTFTDTALTGNWYVVEAATAKAGTEFMKVSIKAELYPSLGT